MELETLLVNYLEKGKKMDSEAIQKAFDSAAERRLDRFLLRSRASSFDFLSLGTRVKSILKEGKSIIPSGAIEALDVGCFIGEKTEGILKMLKELGGEKIRLDSIDLSTKAIQRAQTTNRHKNVHYFQENVLTIKTHKKYDYLFMAGVWHHMEDEGKAAEKVKHLLKPDGIFILMNGFYPERKPLRILALLLQRAYRILVARPGLSYSKPTMSATILAIESKGLHKKGDFLIPGVAGILNTHLLVFQK